MGAHLRVAFAKLLVMTVQQDLTSLSPFQQIEKALRYDFHDAALLRRALTHRSFGTPNNERLEFLGDAVLDTITAHLLYVADDAASEGALSRSRASLVNGKQLAALACDIGLQNALLLGQGEKSHTIKSSILEDAFEAVVGAVFLDAGYDRCRAVFVELLQPLVAAASGDNELKDYKTRLQELMQSSGEKLPKYKLLETHGPDHAKHFIVSVQVGNPERSASGNGPSRKSAEQDAAMQLLQVLEDHK